MKTSKALKRILIFVTVLAAVLTFPGSIGLGYAGASAIESPVYAIDHTANIIHGIGLSTTDTALKANISSSASSLVITKNDGSVFSDGILCTGMSITLFEDSVAEDSLKIAICGDPSGDGALSIVDYTLARLHILGLKPLYTEYETAADINGDGIISINDYTLMRLSILGLKEIVPYNGSLPLTGCVIGIDPGHQAHANYDQELISPTGTETKAKVSAGTYGRFTGVNEYVINLQVALKLKTKLEELGATVIISRESHDVDISNAQRAVMMNDSGADCWIRIHANGSNDPGVRGMFFLVPTPSSMNTTDSAVQLKSVQLAECLSAAALSSTSAIDLGITQRSDQTGFCWSSIPVCTIEMGHMTNEQEDNLLVSDSYQERIAQGLADGFLKYFS